MCTIGYGGIAPSTPVTKIFSCVFVLVGFGFIDILLSGVASYVLDLQENMILTGIHMKKSQQGVLARNYIVDVDKGRMRIRLKLKQGWTRGIGGLPSGCCIEIIIEDLLAADGFISKSEYVIYKLKEMGKIGEKDILEICDQFNKLDPNNSSRSLGKSGGLKEQFFIETTFTKGTCQSIGFTKGMVYLGLPSPIPELSGKKVDPSFGNMGVHRQMKCSTYSSYEYSTDTQNC
ncbi:hypothetical protein V6N12_000116 [Hibiscus sabdariffa]|uniref:Potassium channel domain-containing protein n=1 Tax=Hibiscus sabdariffa TaxID=183260 RepID=A0ABR2AZR7_9ROSI